jgi:hypothetical protein
MTKVFEEYQQAIAAFTEKITQASQAINTNRAEHAVLVQRLEEAVLNDLPTVSIEKDIAEKDAEFQILSYKANALNKANKGKGSNSFVKKAAQAVVAGNGKAMEELRAKWDEMMAELQRIAGQYLTQLVVMGELFNQARALQEEVSMCGADTGVPAYLPRIGEDMDIARRRGTIFMDPNVIANAFISGELPRPPVPHTVDPAPDKRVKVETGEPEPFVPMAPQPAGKR